MNARIQTWKTATAATGLASPLLAEDQAEDLRRLVRERPRRAQIVTVTSGKGGVGKTNLAVNLAIACAALGKRVVVIDVDLGLANVDVVLNVNSRFNLSHVISGKRDILEILTPAPGNIEIVPGATGVERMANLDAGERANLVGSLDKLSGKADLVIVDTGAGISRNVIGFTAAADQVLVVTTPDPTAVIDAYATIKMVLREEHRGDLRLVVNQASTRAEGDRVAQGIQEVVRKFLNAYVDYAGHVLADPMVVQSVRRKRPFLLEYPTGPASLCVQSVARSLLALDARVSSGPRLGFLERLKAAFGRD